MYRLFNLLILVACAHRTPAPNREVKIEHEWVTARTALEQAQMSYLKGCVEANIAMKVRGSFNRCRDLAVAHRQEIELIMTAPVKED
jgi:hypothetical protein